MLLSDAVRAYGEALMDSTLSRMTQKNYRYHARGLAHWLTEFLHRQPRVEDINSPNIRAFLTEKERTVSPGTLYQYYVMTRKLCAWLVKPGNGEPPYLLSNPCERIARPRNVRSKRNLPSAEVIAALPLAPDKIYDPARRLLARAVLSVMMDCGLRPGEVRGLLLTDYDKGAKTLTIRRAKGNKGRVLYLPSKTVDALNDLVRARPSACKHNHLFPANKGKPLGVEGLPKLLNELLYLAGHRPEEDGKVTPRCMRPVAAKKLMKTGATIRELQEIFGWASIQMVVTYVDTDPDELRDALERATQPPAPPAPSPLLINRPDIIREQAKRFRVDRKRVPR